MKNKEGQKLIYMRLSENKATEINTYCLTMMNIKELEFDRKLSN